MGKSAGKIVETLVLQHQPRRYLVTNTERIVLVTHDFHYANRVAAAMQQLDRPAQYTVRVR